MSRSLKSFPEEFRKSVASSRVAKGNREDGMQGLAYWGAKDALKKLEEKKEK